MARWSALASIVIVLAGCAALGDPAEDAGGPTGFDAPPEATFVPTSDAPTCLGPGVYCQATSDCCSGLTCSSGVCTGPVAPTCHATGESCQSSAICCGPGLCSSGQCDSNSCLSSGSACTRNNECCGASLCQSGHCT